MRLAVLSDIHGNELALEAVLADLQEQGGADQLVIAGDLCLDGPRPREVLERVRALACPVVQGNTDRDLARSIDDPGDEHAALLAWTRDRLGLDGVAYLRALPFSHRVSAPGEQDDVLIVHANPRDLDTPLRPLAPENEVTPLLADLPTGVGVVAFGHLHIPYVRSVGPVLLADIASVGLPKDGDRRASYGLFTWRAGAWTVEQRRVEYAVDAVVAQLREAAPPLMQQLIRTLLRARYPNMTVARGGRPRARGKAADAIPAQVTSPTSILPASVPVHTPASSPPVAPRPSRSIAATPQTDTPDSKIALEGLTPGELLGEAVPGLLRSRLDHLVTDVEAVRTIDSPETIHQLRVAIRRLRGLLALGGSCYRKKALQRQEKRLRALARALGRVRDYDVQIDYLQPRYAAALPDEQPGLEALLTVLIAERAESRADLDPFLDRWGVRGAKDFRRFAARVRSDKSARSPVETIAARILLARLEDFVDAAAPLSAGTEIDPEVWHQVRIATKGLRYTLELCQGLAPRAEGLVKRLRQLQDLLGRLHDRDVLTAILAMERTDAAERELDRLDQATLVTGTRVERRRAIRERLDAPDSFARTAPGIYGLLIDVNDERVALETDLHAYWGRLTRFEFVRRVTALAESLSPPDGTAVVSVRERDNDNSSEATAGS